MRTSALIQTCAMCGGRFPGSGVQKQDKVYCCDKCADAAQNKLRMLMAMAPKLAGVLGIGAVIGYLIGNSRH